MAFYEQHVQHSRHASWDPNPAQGRQGAAINGEDPNAFRQQFEEIDRAHENLIKAGRAGPVHGRRESLPTSGPFMNQFPPPQQQHQPHHDPFARPDPQSWDSRHSMDRMQPSRHYSGSEYDGMRSPSSASSVQGFLQSQRFGTPRQPDADSMMQAKRRAAAARERELRNYHQQQQYNRAQPGAKADRALSPPSGQNEEDRRELLQQQHRALYGDSARLYDARPSSQDARAIGPGPFGSNGHAPSPMGFLDSYRGGPGAGGVGLSSEHQQQQQAAAAAAAAPSDQAVPGSRSRSNSTSSKSANPTPFSMFESAHPRTSNGSPIDTSASGSAQLSASSTGASVGAIGTRLPPGSAAAQVKRGTPPMPSPRGPGFGGPGGAGGSTGNSSAPSNGGDKAPTASSLGWGAGSGPWGSSGKSTLGQASVWG